MMQEYWVNVYQYEGQQWNGYCHNNKNNCMSVKKTDFLMYRIHVMIGAKSKYRSYYPMVFKNGQAVFKKPKYDDSFAKYIKRMKPKQTGYVDKSDWMG